MSEQYFWPEEGGFAAKPPLNDSAGYLYTDERSGVGHYKFTPQNHSWPCNYPMPATKVIDAFSPNLNKRLHVGHLRNLAMAVALQRLLPDWHFVALLGASQGVIKDALDDWKWWTSFLSYKAEVYYDVVLPQDVVQTHEQNGMAHWRGPNGPVLVKRSDGRPLYAFWEVAFAEYVKPDYYLTGDEQIHHFGLLGLKDKHLNLGLVLGDHGKKMSSRADAVPAHVLITSLCTELETEGVWQGDTLRQYAWNILAWNLLSHRRTENISCERLAGLNSPGVLITEMAWALCDLTMGFRHCGGKQGLTTEDASLMGLAMSFVWYVDKARKTFDTCDLAHYLYKLTKAAFDAMNREADKTRPGFLLSMQWCLQVITYCMDCLGLFFVYDQGRCGKEQER